MTIDRRSLLRGVVASAAMVSGTRALAWPPLPEKPVLLRRALAALDSQNPKLVARDVMGIVDFSAHSREMRFSIIDVANGRIDASYLVAHGRGSDPANSGWAQKFSNRPGSNASSEGSFLTGATYVGKHGRSRRLHGLDPVNSQAFERAIVVHGASYVGQDLVRMQGRIGRSLGCFAVERSAIDEVLERLGQGRLLFASA